MTSRVLIPGTVVLGLLLIAWADPAPARERSDRAVRNWLSRLVTRIDAADQAARRPGSNRGAGSAVVRVEVAADGSVQRAEIEESSGSPSLDQRALRAVQGVGPLPAPPSALLGLTGVADLSIPVELGP
jgi:TonB family protein